MRVIDYPKDKTNSFKRAVAWLNQNEKYIKKLAGLPVFNVSFGKTNWGMPKSIFSKLNSDQINWLSEKTRRWIVTSSPCKTFQEPVVQLRARAVLN